jgi:hypothetical protein
MAKAKKEGITEIFMYSLICIKISEVKIKK